LRETDGSLNLSRISSVMAGVAAWRDAYRVVSTHIELNALLHIRQLKPHSA
jgi:hypothetical protein